MTLPATVAADLARRLDRTLVQARAVGGGSIHAAFRVEMTGGEDLFVKTSPHVAAGLFAAEAEGLRWLAGFGAVAVPEVVAWADAAPGRPGWLALRFVEPGRGVRDEARLARDLAALHDHGQAVPGWPRANFLGTLPQDNRAATSWSAFWVERRLLPVLERAAPTLGSRVTATVEAAVQASPAVLAEVDAYGPLHGDLWSGNVLWAADGRPWLVDPAVYMGDTEVDLAMMALFGGFGPGFWQAYHAARPRRPGFERRQALYQLYPLLVHVVLFGDGYVGPTVAAAHRVLAD